MANAVAEVEKSKSAYGKIILSLENCILPTEKLSPTPSEIDGLDRDVEAELRILGCELIQTSGILLRLPQVAMATGQVLFQRFYYSKSFVRHSMEVVAMACITLASKIEEAPRRFRDVVNVFHHIKQVRAGKTIQPLILDQNYINLKNQVIKAERRVLKELGFCVHVKHPHKIIVTLLEVLKVKNQKLMQTAWNYMNDSLRSEVFIRYCPETIACACIYLSARVLQIPLPNKPAWYLIFDVTEEDIHDICQIILTLYSFRKPEPERLEKIVEDVRKIHQEAKLKAKGLASMNALLANHSSFSPSSVPSSPKDSKSPNPEIKKEKDEIKNNGVSPKSGRDANHRKRRSISPSADGGNSPHRKKKSKISSSGGSVSSRSRSPSPRRKQKTPPRGYKESHRSRSRSKTREIKKSKHRSSHKLKKKSRSRSASPVMSPVHKRSSNKKAYKSKSSSKSRHASRSPTRNHEHNHHSNSHEKSHKSRNKDKERNSHHSKDKSRR